MNIIYLLSGWNFIVFLLYGLDKRKAMKGKWRISENTLILLAFLMGGIGTFMGMNVFRHKTNHTKYRLLIPLAIIMNVLTAGLFINLLLCQFFF